MARLALAALTLLSAAPRLAPGEPWTQTIPTGVSLNAVAFLSATRVVAVGDNGVVLLSTDGGAGWVNVGPGGANLNDVLFNGAKGVAVGDGGRILYSPDSGASWNDVSVPARSENLNAVAVSGTALVAVGDGKATGPPAGRYFTVVRSLDGGATWAEVPGASFPAIGQKPLRDVAFVDANILIAVGDRQGPNPTVLRSTNGGLSWGLPTTLNNPPNQNFNALTVSGNTVMAVGDKDGPTVAMYRSTDKGDNWDLPGTFPSGPPNNVPLLDIALVSVTRFIAVGDQKAGAAGYRILITSDGGDNWVDAAVPAGSQNLTAVTYGNGLALAVGDNGTILASTDQGSTWTLDDTQGSAANLLDVAIINPAIAVGSGGQVLRRTAAGGGALGAGALDRGIYVLESDTVDVPIGCEWLAALLLLAAALYRLR